MKISRWIIALLPLWVMPAFAEPSCDELHNRYTVDCSQQDAQCEDLLACTSLQEACLAEPSALSTPAACEQANACVSNFYREELKAGRPTVKARQCGYDWKARQQRCQPTVFPWHSTANRCPGASVAHKGEFLPDPGFECAGSQQRYTALRAACTAAKAELQQRCGITMRPSTKPSLARCNALAGD